MSYCDGMIAQDLVAKSCANPPKKGFDKVGYILNRSAITALTFSQTKKNVISTLTGTAYKIIASGADPFNGTTSEVEVGTYVTTFTKNVVFALLNNDQAQSESVIDSLAEGEFVVILKAKDAGSGSSYLVYGIHNGLTLSAYSEDFNGDAFGGALITLTEKNAPLSRVYLGESDSAAETIIEALIEE